MLETFRVLINMGTLHRLLPLWLVGMAVFIFAFSPWFLVALAYGMVLQFLTEYVMHRFIYHREPPTEQSTFNALYRAHISHHEFPTDAEFFTGDDHWYAVRFALISFAIHTAVLWPFVGLTAAAALTAVALFVGSISAFTFYEYCHTLAHLKVKKGWFGQKITQSHLIHHFQDHDATFHVSFGMGWIDSIFGTRYDQETAKARYDRETILSLGMDPEDLRLVTARKAFGISKLPRGRQA
ncbi:sterol desaturase family protein [Litoreibacter janthinus]|uniref:Fatty acid hydroxylase superfamily protein n=1 Tax=Litoreibacter janthinus TaxID=670154 RepID=A0A1I6G3H3_9RHOB|nr:sterol desaturase family protein [Litoreibacter janthinus]SFR36597.1 Fatty acid hydroxylase superfamily protein [Litoreibacter janthinus]